MTVPTSNRFDVAVIGSINNDIVCDLDHLPSPGETLMARQVRSNIGGKGANQAVAATKAGARSLMIGRLGDDPVGRRLLDGLHAAGVDTSGIETVPGKHSGAAYINVADGANTIIVDAGANWSWPAHLGPYAAALRGAAVVVAQLEIPDEVVLQASHATKARFMLNAAPARPVADDVLRRCDPLVVNEHELSQLTGMRVPGPQEAITAQHQLRSRGVPSVVATLGVLGATIVDETGERWAKAPKVDAVDSTGAGDAFVGALAARLAKDPDLHAAVDWAITAASLSVQHQGTHDSYAELAAIEYAHEHRKKET